MGWGVDFVGLHGTVGQTEYVRTLQRQGVAVHGNRGLRREDGSWTEGESFAVCVDRGNFELALLSFWPVAEYCLPVLRRLSPNTRVIVDSVDVHFLREARQITGDHCVTPPDRLLNEHFGARLVAELNAYAAADATLTVSATERQLLERMLGDSVVARVVGDCEDPLPSPVPMTDRSGILFVGSYEHPPNVQAIEFFLRQVLPRIDVRLLDKHPVYVVGNGLNERICGLAEGHPHVRMVGWVPSVVPYFHKVRATVVPLLHGAGTKRKVIQALMYGTPLVSTDIGTEGLDLVPNKHALVANDASAIAASVERLLTDENLCRSLTDRGMTHIRGIRSRETARAALAEVVGDVLKVAAKPAMLADGSVQQYLARLTKRPARPQTNSGVASAAADGPKTARLIAFYLPQFHPIPENDAWWGRGFTEWRNVCKAKPLFSRHHQPQLPTDLGFYDLRVAEARKAQAELAHRYGIHGFCYYHYWFQGKRLLERPFAEVLASGQPDFPFCLCWANEPWSRRWDGSDADLLQPQGYSTDDDLAHIRWLLGPLTDPRAIRIDGRPVFIVYRADQLPNPVRTTDCWRREADRAGVPGLYLMAVETGWDAGWDATRVGFDAKVLFQPQFSLLDTAPRWDVCNSKTKVFDYASAWPVLANPPTVSYPRFDTVFPGWDNTARRGENAWVVHGNTPASYEEWLRLAVDRTLTRPQDQRVVFINAWNEWAEGAHLEPDRKHGRGFLEATCRVVAPTRVHTP
jgi:glycosyltransferase involved in cell wall biosynthesis